MSNVEILKRSNEGHYEREETMYIPIASSIEYTPLKILGKGTYGTVHLSKYNRTQEQFAIKYQNYQLQPQSVLREMAIFSRVKSASTNQNVMSAVTFIYNRTRFGIVMEVVSMDLSKAIANDIVSRNIEKYAYQIVRGVTYLHSRDILHRDLKPQNILYDQRNDKMLIADFGMSRAMECTSVSGLTKPVVTLHYRAPELLLGGSRYTYAIDIWSLGCILHELILKTPLIYAINEPGMVVKIIRNLGKFTNTNMPGYMNYPGWNPQFENVVPLPIEQVLNYTSIVSRPHDWRILIMQMLRYNPDDRIKSHDILSNNLFDRVRQPHEPAQLTCLDNLYLREVQVQENFYNESGITERMREITLDWMLSVCVAFKSRRETFFMARYLMDQYLSSRHNRSNLQLYACACMYVAYNYFEFQTLDVPDFVYVADGAFNDKELDDEILSLLKSINSDLVQGLDISFVKEYCRLFYNPKIAELATNFLIMGSMMNISFRWSASQSACWAIYYACLYYDEYYKHERILSSENIRSLPLTFSRSLRHTWKALASSISLVDIEEKFNKDFMEIDS